MGLSCGGESDRMKRGGVVELDDKCGWNRGDSEASARVQRYKNTTEL